MGAKRCLQISTIIAGVLLLALSVVRFVKINTLNFSQTLLTVYMV